MISLSQILPRAQRHTSFTVTSGLAVATETRGGGYREVGGLVDSGRVCVYWGGGGQCRLGRAMGFGGGGGWGRLSPDTHPHQSPSATLLDEKGADNGA